VRSRAPLLALAVLTAVAAGVFVGGRGHAAAAAVAKKPENSGMLNWKKVAAGTKRTIYQTKQFKVIGMCLDNGGGDFTAAAYLATKQDHASYFVSSGPVSSLDFNRADAPVRFNVGAAAHGAVPDFQAWDHYAEVYAESESGVTFIARAATAVHVFGADCVFSGLFQDGKTATPPSNRKAVAAGQSVKLFDNKDFTVTGDCVDNGGGDYSAVVGLKTKKDNAAVMAAFGTIFDLDFDVADGPMSLPTATTGTAPSFAAFDYYQEFVAIGADGKMLILRYATGVHRSVDCTFSGLVTFSGSDITRSLVLVPAGGSTVLWDSNQFQLVGTCIDNGGGDFTAQTSLVTKEDGAMYFITDSGVPVFGFDSFDPAAPFDHFPANGTAPDMNAFDYYSEVYAVSASGRSMIARPVTTVHMFGGDCGFALRAQD
jgi:hypothetical protein